MQEKPTRGVKTRYRRGREPLLTRAQAEDSCLLVDEHLKMLPSGNFSKISKSRSSLARLRRAGERYLTRAVIAATTVGTERNETTSVKMRIVGSSLMALPLG
jgi:hypothetical protein